MLMRYEPFLVLALLSAAPAAVGQTPKPYAGEIVITASGQLTGDWKEVPVCKDRNPCQSAIINTKTREAARLGERWSTEFEPTGNRRRSNRRASGGLSV
jgi:hypothetical protein